MTIPENVAWSSMVTAVASPYPDLTVMTVGDDIQAGIIDSETDAFCTNDITGETSAYNCAVSGQCELDCPTGSTFIGERTLYLMGIDLNRPAFESGGVQLVSDEAGTVQSMSFAIGAAGSGLQITAGTSDGAFPVDANFPNVDELYIADNFMWMELLPHEPSFGYLDAFPYLVCEPNGPSGGDMIGINTAELPPDLYDVTCGTLPISFTLTPQYDSVGECISASIDAHCKQTGLKGRARASCNAAQIGNCHAAFHVPSNHNQ